MQSVESCIKDTSNFLRNRNQFERISGRTTLVKAVVVGLYSSIPYGDSLDALPIKLDKRGDESLATEDLLQMAKFVLKRNYLEFNLRVKQQVLGTAIGTKFVTPYACIFMDRLLQTCNIFNVFNIFVTTTNIFIEIDFLNMEQLKPLV